MGTSGGHYDDDAGEATKGDYDYEDDEPSTPPMQWFLHDMEAVKAGHRDKNAQSWYTQLSRVASGILVQCVLMSAGHQTRGGSKVNYDHNRLRQLLERIPTPPRTDHPPQFPHFPITTRSVDEWVEHFAMIQGKEVTADSIPPTKGKADVVAAQDDKFAEIKATFENNDKKDEFTPAKLQYRHQAGIMKTANSHDAISAQMQGIGTTLSRFLESDFAHTAFYPPAPMAPPEWTPFLQTMAVSNVYGQVELMAAKLGQVGQGLKLVQCLCDTYMKELELRKKELVQKAALIHDIQEKLGITVDETMKLSGKVYDLQCEVSEGMKDPKTAQYVRFHDPSRKALFSTNTH